MIGWILPKDEKKLEKWCRFVDDILIDKVLYVLPFVTLGLYYLAKYLLNHS